MKPRRPKNSYVRQMGKALAEGNLAHAKEMFDNIEWADAKTKYEVIGKLWATTLTNALNMESKQWLESLMPLQKAVTKLEQNHLTTLQVLEGWSTYNYDLLIKLSNQKDHQIGALIMQVVIDYSQQRPKQETSNLLSSLFTEQTKELGGGMKTAVVELQLSNFIAQAIHMKNYPVIDWALQQCSIDQKTEVLMRGMGGVDPWAFKPDKMIEVLESINFEVDDWAIAERRLGQEMAMEVKVTITKNALEGRIPTNIRAKQKDKVHL